MELEGLKPVEESADPQAVENVSSFAEILRDTIDAMESQCWPERWRVQRIGERKPISAVTRRLVYQRDGFACGHCGSGIDLQLDHILPWSAGGTDRSDNLRTLCGTCTCGGRTGSMRCHRGSSQ